MDQDWWFSDDALLLNLFGEKLNSEGSGCYRRVSPVAWDTEQKDVQSPTTEIEIEIVWSVCYNSVCSVWENYGKTDSCLWMDWSFWGCYFYLCSTHLPSTYFCICSALTFWTLFLSASCCAWFLQDVLNGREARIYMIHLLPVSSVPLSPKFIWI